MYAEFFPNKTGGCMKRSYITIKHKWPGDYFETEKTQGSAAYWLKLSETVLEVRNFKAQYHLTNRDTCVGISFYPNRNLSTVPFSLPLLAPKLKDANEADLGKTMSFLNQPRTLDLQSCLAASLPRPCCLLNPVSFHSIGNMTQLTYAGGMTSLLL